MTDKHLWEANHPYYCSEGNYFATGQQGVFSSWADFLEEMGDADDDYNLVFRWDWNQEARTLSVYYVKQRKAANSSCDVTVSEEDEPKIREWLAIKWAKIQAIWAPFSGVENPKEDLSCSPA